MLTLLNLLSAVALLVWGTHIVRTGIMRVYGADLRRVLSRSVEKTDGFSGRHWRYRSGTEQQRHYAAGHLVCGAKPGQPDTCPGGGTGG